MINGSMTGIIVNFVIHAHIFFQKNCNAVSINKSTKTTLRDHSTPLSEFCQLIF